MTPMQRAAQEAFGTTWATIGPVQQKLFAAGWEAALRYVGHQPTPVVKFLPSDDTEGGAL